MKVPFASQLRKVVIPFSWRRTVSADDREHASSPDSDSNLPIDDLSPGALDLKGAEQVRGGAGTTTAPQFSDIVVTKKQDIGSTTLHSN